jgi:hypothetical protein
VVARQRNLSTRVNPSLAPPKIAWRGANKQAAAQGKKIRLYLATWENPKPEKKVKTIDFTTTKETPCAPFCVAITAETK